MIHFFDNLISGQKWFISHIYLSVPDGRRENAESDIWLLTLVKYFKRKHANKILLVSRLLFGNENISRLSLIRAKVT